MLDEEGIELRVVKHYCDGIIALDPVKCVLYDPQDKSIGETPYVVFHPKWHIG